MKKRQMKIGLRGLLGAALLFAATLLVLNLNTVQSFTVSQETNEIPAVKVETFSQNTKMLVCPPQAAILGLDTQNPDFVTPVGEPKMVTTEQFFASGESPQKTVLTAPENSSAEFTHPPQALAATGENMLAAAVTQNISLQTASGTVAAACQETSNDQWIVAGDTTLGTTGMIMIVNPGLVSATVNLTVYDEQETVDERGVSGVLLAPQSSKIVSLAGFGVGKTSTVVRVQSSGAQVSASLVLTEIKDLTPTGSAQVNAQLKPEEQLVFAGIKNYTDHVHTEEAPAAADLGLADPTAEDPGAAEENVEEFPAVVRVFSPEENGSAEIIGLSKNGEILLGKIEFEAAKAIDTAIASLPEEVDAIVLNATTPILAGIKTAVHTNDEHDFTWYSPTQIVAATDTVSVAAVAKAAPTLANLSDLEQTVTVNTGSTEEPKNKEITLQPWSTTTLETGKSFTATGTQKIAVGMLVFDGNSIASYPVFKFTDEVKQLIIYPSS